MRKMTEKPAIFKYTVMVFVAALIVMVFIVAYKSIRTDHGEYPLSRKIRYSFTLQNTTSQLKKNVDFWVYAPVERTSLQKVQSITANTDFNLQKDEIGNQILHFVFAEIPPYSSKIVTITAQLNLAEHPNRMREGEHERYLLAEKYIHSDDSRIIDLAHKLATDGKSETARKLFHWVNTNIKYAGYIRDDRGSLYALKTRKGDCTEFMYLFVALARATGIAARGIGGYVKPENAVLKPEEFHNWAEIYLDGAWQVVDPQNGMFLKNQSDFIAMRIIDNKSKLHLRNTHQFAVSNKDITVRMN